MEAFAKRIADEIEDLMMKRCLGCHINSSEDNKRVCSVCNNLMKTKDYLYNAVLNLCLKDNRPETFYHVLNKLSHCYPSYNFILSEKND